MKLSLFSLKHQLCSIPKLPRFGLNPLIYFMKCQSGQVVFAFDDCVCPSSLFFDVIHVIHVEEESRLQGIVGEVPREHMNGIQFVHAGKLALLATAGVGGRAAAVVAAVPHVWFAGIKLKTIQVAPLVGRIRLPEWPRLDFDAAASKHASRLALRRHLHDFIVTRRVSFPIFLGTPSLVKFEWHQPPWG